MARIVGVDIPKDKRIYISLTYIHGIGEATSKKILSVANVKENKIVENLTKDEVSRIRDAIDQLGIRVEGELKRFVKSNIKRLKDINCYRGIRHKKSLPVRGQKTQKNARTRKGPRKTVGGLQQKVTKK